MACDLKFIPPIHNANHSVSRQQVSLGEGLLLPGGVTLTYTCDDGYVMSSGHETAKCEYDRQPRENDSDNIKVTTMWKGHQNIKCSKDVQTSL